MKSKCKVNFMSSSISTVTAFGNKWEKISYHVKAVLSDILNPLTPNP